MTCYKIAPSSLSFLWSKCPRCFWRKARGVQEAKDNNMMFAVGNAFDREAKKSMTPDVIESLGCPKLNYLKCESEWVKSKPIEFEDLGVSIYFNGKTDRKYLTPEENIYIMDFKAGSCQHLEKYTLAMHAYLWAVENPEIGDGIPVDGLGLIAMHIDQENAYHMKSDRCSILGHLQFHPLEIDRVKFLEQMRDVASILSLPTPPKADFWCEFCKSVEDAKALDYKSSEAA